MNNSLISTNKTNNIFDEMKILVVASLPLSISAMFMTIEGLFVLYFIRITTSDPDFTNGYSLANSLLMLLSNSLIFALNGGMQARISQAFGNEDAELCGLYFHRGTLINLCLTIPLMIPLFFTGNILSSIGSTPGEASIAQTYINIKIPATIFNTIYISIMGVYYGCRKFKVPAIIQAFSTSIGCLLTYLFLVQWGWGIAGIGLATDVSNALSVILIVIHAKMYGPMEGVFFKPKKESFQEIWSLLKFELCVGGMSWFDFAASKALTLVTAGLSPNDQDGYNVASALNTVVLPIMLGVSIGTQTYVGNMVGDRNRERAQRFLVSGLLLGVIVGTICSVIAFFFRAGLLTPFASNSLALSYAEDIFAWFCLDFPIAAACLILNGAIKVIGKEKSGLLLVALCDFFILVPFSYFFVFTIQWGAVGLVVAGLIDFIAKTLVFGVSLKKADWDEQIELVQSTIYGGVKKAKEALIRRKTTELIRVF